MNILYDNLKKNLGSGILIIITDPDKEGKNIHSGSGAKFFLAF
jgi:5S rRNA maturation endonuclease (ribonuclease M5)